MEFSLDKVISEEYRAMIQENTKDMPWGGAVISSVPKIYEYALEYDCKSILDYGSGKSDFFNTLNESYPDHQFKVNQYEPARPEFEMDPEASDMTVCVDVMEHIEQEKLEAVLDHIADKTNKILYFKVCMLPSHNKFKNGQNLHLIIENKDFWLDKLSKYYNLDNIIVAPGHVWGLAIKK